MKNPALITSISRSRATNTKHLLHCPHHSAPISLRTKGLAFALQRQTHAIVIYRSALQYNHQQYYRS